MASDLSISEKYSSLTPLDETTSELIVEDARTALLTRTEQQESSKSSAPHPVISDGCCKSVSANIEERNMWVSPADFNNNPAVAARRTAGVIELLVVVGVLFLGIYILYSDDLYTDWPNLFFYIVASLTADFFVLVFTGSLLLFFWLCCGETSVFHAAPFTSILLQCLQAVACYAISGFGFYFIIMEFGRLNKKRTVLMYLLAETAIATIYTFTTCPSVIGGLKYAFHKIAHKIRRDPVVIFHRQDRPPTYTACGENFMDIDQALQHMHRPVNSPEIFKEQKMRIAESQLRLSQKEPNNILETSMGIEIGSLDRSSSEVLLQKMGVTDMV